MDKLLAVVNDPSNGNSYIYVGTVSGGSPTQTRADTEYYERCHIDPADDTRMVVAGHDVNGQVLVLFSDDTGVTWTAGTVPALLDSAVRMTRFAGGSTLFVLTADKLLRSTDDAATFSDITPPVTGTVHMDLCINSVTNAVLLKSFTNGNAGGMLFRTVNGGTSFALTLDLQSLVGWQVGEAPRRLTLTGDSEVYLLLTSHRVYRLRFDGVAWASNVLWNHDLFMAVNLPGLGPTGYVGSVDRNNRFDDLQVDGPSGRTWLGGYRYLRAHSFDQVSWFLSDTTVVDFTATGTDQYVTHRFVSPNIGFAGSADESPVVVPHKPGLWKSTDGGATTSAFAVFPPKYRLAHHWATPPALTTGCTLPEACNYNSDAVVDDGTCQQVVLLTDCSDGSTHHTANPAIVALGCRLPAWNFDVQAIDPDTTNLAFQVIQGGTPLFTFNVVVGTDASPEERLEAFLGQLVAYINATTVYRATRLDPMANTLVPGSVGGVQLLCPTSSCAGISVITTQFGLLGLTSNTGFDNGNNARIVKVAEYPGQCFVVCGPGDCAQAETLTLQADYPDCFRCLPEGNALICRDCNQQVRTGSTYLIATPTDQHIQCVVAGQYLHIEPFVGFPSRTPQVFAPVSNTCSGVAPLELVFGGNQTTQFPMNSQFTTAPDGNVYTVAAVTYDQGQDRTTVRTVEYCTELNAIEQVSNFTNCGCQVRVRVFDGTNAVLVDQTFSCTDHIAQGNVVWLVPEYGNYRVRIDAADCADSKVCEYWFDACGQYGVTQTACHQYRIDLQRPSGAPVTGITSHVVITDKASGTVVVDVTIPDSAFPYAFSGTQDTVYQVQVTTSNGTLTSLDVIDTCDLLACQRKLTLDLFCGDDDPCDTNCERTAQREQQRLELSRISLLFSQLRDEVGLYTDRYRGLVQYDTVRIQDLQAITDLVTAIRSTALRCGVCTATSNIVTAPCLNCQ